MVAPTGVNGGLAQEPAKAGRAAAELRDGPAAEAEPASAAPAQGIPAAAEAGQAETGQAETGLVTPAETGFAETGFAETGFAETGFAETGFAETEQAGPAQGQAWLAEGELAEPDEAGWDRAEKESRDVRPLAVLGIIAGVIALVGVAVGVLAVVTHGFRPKTVITYRPAAAFGLRPGQCLNAGPNALDVTVLSCARPHDAEVFAAFGLPAAAWPGAAAVRAEASDGCASRFGSYLNPDLATVDLSQEFIYPNQAAWRAGQRTVICEVRSTSGRLTGSVRAKG